MTGELRAREDSRSARGSCESALGGADGRLLLTLGERGVAGADSASVNTAE